MLKTLIILFSSLMLCGSLIVQEELFEVEGAIQIGNSDTLAPDLGTIRWTDCDFEGWNGTKWMSLTGAVKAGTVSDIDGNTYSKTTICTQEWMTENLRARRYKDGSLIDSVTAAGTWAGLSAAHGVGMIM